MSEGRNHGLLAAIAPRFTRELENVATEALGYILGRSPRAEKAFRDLITQVAGASLPERLTWRTQSGGDDNAIPDLVGEDSAGRQRVIVEAKFWAELTSNQPGTYLERLRSQEAGGVLLFVAPKVRLEGLWQEIRRACPEGTSIGSEENRLTETRCATVMGRHKLALASWSSLIDTLRNEAAAAGEMGVTADLEQLRGLIERVDEEAFLPLWPEDLSKRFPSRILQFRDLVQDAVLGLTRDGANDLGLKRRRWAAGPGWFGIYVEIRRPLIGLLYFSAIRWAADGTSPFWFQLTTEGVWKCPRDVREKLGRIALEEPRRVIEDDWGPTIPILLPMGVEKEHVVRAIVGQVTRIVSAVVEAKSESRGEAGGSGEESDSTDAAPGEVTDEVHGKDR